MMITLDTLNHWLILISENERLEFKEAHRDYDIKKLMKYCIALANERGGYLVFGVSNKPPRRVVGTSTFSNIEDIKNRILAQLHFRIEVTELQHSDGRVLVFQIPSRPIGRPLQFEGAYWMRAGESLTPMTPDQLQRIFAEGQPDFLEKDATANVSADEIVAALDIQTFFDLIKLPLPATREAILKRLISEKLIRVNNGNFTITNLGAILLAKDLRNFDSLKRKTIRIVKYKANNKLDTEREHISHKGYATGFEELIGYINSQLPMNEIIGRALREEVRMYPEIVVRELIANALIHQDLNQTGSSIMVEIYGDRIEITNPGQPLIAVERFIDEYQSRNERLADVMRRMDAADRMRACYLHCCLKYVSNERMTNQSLRERFKLDDTRAKSAIVSQIIAFSVEQARIKPDDPGNASKRYARYIPFWA